MAGFHYSNFQEPVQRAAEAALKRSGSVGPLELFLETGLLHPCHVEGWRKGNEHCATNCSWSSVPGCPGSNSSGK